MSEWMPIESAPRDGTTFYAPNRQGDLMLVRWYDNPFGHRDTVIHDASGRWWTVSHWLPLLPAPPAAMKDGGTARLDAQREHDAGRRE